ncbi:Ferritin and Dps [Rhodopseudomonas palustris HaA2]|uniref:Ferritin and Dps n=1 Tax=Rhodopseudomonas palustris (strain HaA2) TaxID=316058 RepID=Q2IR77_RHOP2|nr:DNA starvation/stationary phase protection protein [Rhodopseudomonas palustris]ABD09283.1 Ferritin and Dps [Rhodopseudomonas palustris HaA2]
MTNAAQTTTDALSRVLGRTFGLYVQTHGYHWNVVGPEFRRLHAAFEEQYNDLWNALDDIAERIRSLGAHAPGSLAELTGLAGASPAPAQSAEAMVGALMAGHEALIEELRRAIASAQQDGDEPTVGLLSDRTAWHQKQLWMMKAARA